MVFSDAIEQTSLGFWLSWPTTLQRSFKSYFFAWVTQPQFHVFSPRVCYFVLSMQNGIVGEGVGLIVGSLVGWDVGDFVGSDVGLVVVSIVGWDIGDFVGLDVGLVVGSFVGSDVGDFVGSDVLQL